MNILTKFSKKQIATVDLGVELYKHYLYERENNLGQYSRFATFANTTDNSGHVISFKDKNNIFSNMLADEAYEISGLDKERFGIRDAFAFQTFERAYFSVVEAVINKINAKTEIESALNFAEVKSIADGDSLTFHIPSNHLLSVSTVANGVRSVHFQNLWEEDITLNPKRKKIGVKIDTYRLATGMYDWGWLLNQVVKSFRTKLQQEVINIIYGAYSTLATNFKETTYAQDSYIRLAERVAAANGGITATSVGTKTALNKILPTNDYMKMPIGREYVDVGYIQAPFGIPTLKLEQSINPNSAYDFALDNNYVILMSIATDKLVKIGTEGRSTIRASKEYETSDGTNSYTITDSWDLKIISMAYFGIVKVS